MKRLGDICFMLMAIAVAVILFVFAYFTVKSYYPTQKKLVIEIKTDLKLSESKLNEILNDRDQDMLNGIARKLKDTRILDSVQVPSTPDPAMLEKVETSINKLSCLMSFYVEYRQSHRLPVDSTVCDLLQDSIKVAFQKSRGYYDYYVVIERLNEYLKSVTPECEMLSAFYEMQKVKPEWLRPPFFEMEIAYLTSQKHFDIKMISYTKGYSSTYNQNINGNTFEWSAVSQDKIPLK